MKKFQKLNKRISKCSTYQYQSDPGQTRGNTTPSSYVTKNVNLDCCCNQCHHHLIAKNNINTSQQIILKNSFSCLILTKEKEISEEEGSSSLSMTTQEALTVNMDPQLIIDVTGTAGLSLLDCEECLEDSHAKVYNRHPKHQWCVGLQCRQYPTHPLWWVCTTCTNQRKVMKDASQLQRHNRIHHEGRINKKARSSVSLEEEEVSMDKFHMESELPDQVPADTLSALSAITPI